MTLARLIDPIRLPPYDLGSMHPFARDRLVPLMDLMARSQLVSDQDFLPSMPAGDELLRLAHDQDYIDLIRALSDAEPSPAQRRIALGFGMGTDDNPISRGQHDAGAAVAGATVACVRAVLDGTARHTFNPAGGLHHAMRRAAAGFCIYNDLVVGIREARRLGMTRVCYLDLDVHHGDGVERAFEEDPSVMTVSLHQSPDTCWPGTGHAHERGVGAGAGTVVNVPLDPGTGDGEWIAALEQVVPAIEQFAPQMIVSQHGCDPHLEDPLAQLAVTTRGFMEAARIVHELANRLCEGRWVATGGGGYQPVRVLPRAWSILWAEMAGRPLPDLIDEGWRRAYATHGPLPLRFLDP